MTKEEIEKMIGEGFETIKPKVGEMTNLMMDCYQQGFKVCWKLLTGQEWI